MITLFMMRVEEMQSMFDQELLCFYPDKNERDMLCLMALEPALGPLNRMSLHLRKKEVLQASEVQTLREVLLELKHYKPIQYVLGKANFYGIELGVNASTLIPRPETEELVRWIIDDLSADQAIRNLSLLDIGTGSGCIAISLKKFVPSAQVMAIDVSSAALEVARDNALKNQLDIDFQEVDVLKGTKNHFGGIFDILVSNPPYVRMSEKLDMSRNVLDFEPHLALFVEDHDPLLFYRAIAEMGFSHLRAGGFIYFEINESLAPELMVMMGALGYQEIILRKDIHGKNRMLKAQKGN